MVETSAWTLRVPLVLLLLWPNLLDCQHIAERNKVPGQASQRPDYRQDPGNREDGLPRSWGAWGPWAACSRSCGGGVQEQSRTCIPVDASPAAQSPGLSPNPGHVVSALRPSVPLHRDGGGALRNSSTRPGSHNERRAHLQDTRDPRLGHRGHIVPGKYGYGKMPYVMPLQTDMGQEQAGLRTRRPRQGSLQGKPSLSRRRGLPRVPSRGYSGLHQQPGEPPPGVEAHRSLQQPGEPPPRADPHRGLQRPGEPPPRADPHRGLQRPWELHPRADPHRGLQQPGELQPRADPHRGLQQPGELQPRADPHRGLQQPDQAHGPQLNPYSGAVVPVAHGNLPSITCPGPQKQHRMCNTNVCPPDSRHVREVQCSSYNSQPFMGRLYEWEPFTDVQGEQRCELNCRAAGFRFYVRQSEKVIDGTPCGHNETAVCVEGTCQTLGCDGYLGSDKAVDRCGVCGGDNATCRLVSGLFKHDQMKMGYHKVVEIPEGATKINVTEMIKSRNYLALRSRSGRSIVNGQWAIDRPGKYEGAGTMFTYRRPNEISSTAGESLLAEGPTNEILDVYMIYQQPNPGIHYEFILPVDNPQLSLDTRPEGNSVDGRGEYTQAGNPSQQGYQRPNLEAGNQVSVPQPPRRHREHNWKLAGFTDCSVSCGRGSRHTVFHCVHKVTLQPVTESLCDSATRPSPQEEPCNVDPCPAFWDIGEWSECSRTCGPGQQQRQVLCRQMYANHTLNVHTARCRHLERPDTTTSCQLKICSEWQIRSEWSTCSVPCGVGQRSREVRCVSNVGDFVADEECNMKLRPSDIENCDVGPCAKSWFFTDWGSRCSSECGFGVKTRGVLCLTNHVSSFPLEGCGQERPADTQACNNGPCESHIEWFTGQWSQCSADCGPGRQQRELVCLMKSEQGFSVLPHYECSSLERPLAQQSCQLKACGAKWYHTEWSACSKTCEGGFRVREVRCLSDDMVPSDTCEAQLRPKERESCNSEPCVPEIDENCRDKHFNCNVVVQARLCIYVYYQTTCCASCTRVAQRHSGYRAPR